MLYFSLLTCLGVSCVVMTEQHYPPPLAFCFLKELMIEFAQRYDTHKVNSAKRPYEFIEYGKYSYYAVIYSLVDFINITKPGYL